MSKGFIETRFHWQTTPKELREIADKMEAQYAKSLPGNSTNVRDIYLSEIDPVVNILSIHFDQSKMP
jgi:hypothetical protein